MHSDEPTRIRPWFPPGTEFSDVDTAEVGRAFSEPLESLIGMTSEFKRKSRSSIEHHIGLGDAFELVSMQGEHDGFWGLTAAETFHLARANASLYADLWSCGATVAFSALVLAEVETDAALKNSLDLVGSEFVTMKELAKVIGQGLGLSLEWELVEGADLGGLEGDYLVVTDPAGWVENPSVRHVVLAHFGSEYAGRVTILDFPLSVVSSSVGKAFNCSTPSEYPVLSLAGTAKGAADGEGSSWFPWLLGLAGVVVLLYSLRDLEYRKNKGPLWGHPSFLMQPEGILAPLCEGRAA